MKLVYATSNPGKFEEVKKLFSALHLTVHAPAEFGVELVVEEDGKTLEENAIKKAESYRDKLGEGYAVLGDDTGVEIAALDGQPGIHVRRWKGYEMTDEEIIDYCMSEMKDVPNSEREAEMRTVLAIASLNRPTLTYAGILPGAIVDKPAELKMKGFPFESIFLADEYDMMLGEIHQLPIETKMKKNILTHRERAVISALPYIKGLLDI